MASAEEDYDAFRFKTPVLDNLHCAICLSVLRDAMQCVRNEHLFCKGCITRHLLHTQKCPTCIEPLTLETVRPSRLARELVEHLMTRCDSFDHDIQCPDIGKVESLSAHVAECELNPVQCTNIGCDLVMSRRDQIQHELNECSFRNEKCVHCGTDVPYAKRLVHCKADQSVSEMARMEEAMTDLTKEMTNLTNTVAQHWQQFDQISSNIEEMNKRLSTLEETFLKNDRKHGSGRSTPSSIDLANTKVEGNIIVIGGIHSNQVEQFCWESQTWGYIRNMKVGRWQFSSFVHEGKMFTVGGMTEQKTSSIQVFDITDIHGDWCESPCKLPMRIWGHSSVVHNGHLYVFGGATVGKVLKDVYKISLEPPYTCELVCTMPEERVYHGAHLFGDKVIIVGGATEAHRHGTGFLASILEFDTTNNTCQLLPVGLPHPLCRMATVATEDSIFMFGGKNTKRNVLDSVLVYSVKNGNCSTLPHMKERRTDCCAVMNGNVVVVMGGKNGSGWLNSVECFELGQRKWRRLPPMIEKRICASAVVNKLYINQCELN